MKRPIISPYHVTVENGRRVLISDCKRILEYSPEGITVLLGKATVSVRGKELTLCDFLGDEIQINGTVELVCFNGDKDEK